MDPPLDPNAKSFYIIACAIPSTLFDRELPRPFRTNFVAENVPDNFHHTLQALFLGTLAIQRVPYPSVVETRRERFVCKTVLDEEEQVGQIR